MIATTVMAPVASGLLTTISLDEDIVKVLCLLGFRLRNRCWPFDANRGPADNDEAR